MYEMNVETAQKRAYASNCYRVLLSEYSRDDGERRRHLQDDGGISFIVHMTALAHTDSVVLVSNLHSESFLTT